MSLTKVPVLLPCVTELPSLALIISVDVAAITAVHIFSYVALEWPVASSAPFTCCLQLAPLGSVMRNPLVEVSNVKSFETMHGRGGFPTLLSPLNETKFAIGESEASMNG